MEYTYDPREKAWFNLETFQYDNNFDPKTNKRRLKIMNSYHGRFSAKYTYRDSEDIKLIFSNGDLFGQVKSSVSTSSFWIQKEKVVNYNKVVKNIIQNYSYLGKCIRISAECLSQDNNIKQIELFNKKLSKKFKKELTTEQKLYIELNRDTLGLEGYDI